MLDLAEFIKTASALGLTEAGLSRLFPTVADTSQGRIYRLGGVVRPVWNSGTSTNAWEWIADPGHANIGFGTPSVDANGLLILPFTGTFTKIVDVAITSDETMAVLGVMPGPSVQVTQAVVTIASNTMQNALISSTGNTSPGFSTSTTGWSIGGYDSSTGILTLNHPPAAGLVVNCMSRVTNGSGSVVGRPSNFAWDGSLTATQTKVRLMDGSLTTRTGATGSGSSSDIFTIGVGGSGVLNASTTNFGPLANFWVGADLLVSY